MEEADRHADERERRRRKAKDGMQVRGRSVRLLARLITSGKRKKKRRER